MPHPIAWTPDHDHQLRRMRADGASWDAIAAALGVSRWASMERGRKVGARMNRPATQPKVDPLAAELATPARAALPAGHSFTWGLLTDGTLLAGSAYPWPPLAAGEVP
jgi:hypothetical protein